MDEFQILILSLSPIVVSGLIGILLDIRAKVTMPVPYWMLGVFGGQISASIYYTLSPVT